MNIACRAVGSTKTFTIYGNAALVPYPMKVASEIPLKPLFSAAVRAYHENFISEKVFKRWYLPDTLPDVRPRRKVSDSMSLDEFSKRNAKLEDEIEKKRMASLMFREVERRLDVIVFSVMFRA